MPLSLLTKVNENRPYKKQDTKCREIDFPCIFCAYTAICFYKHLLEFFQIPICSASLIRSSRKSGCAMLIKSSALSHVDLPLRSTSPYSVTIWLVAIRGVVTIAPFGSTGEIRDSSWPSLPTLVDGVQRKAFTASGLIRPQHEVELSAGAADLLMPRRFASRPARIRSTWMQLLTDTKFGILCNRRDVVDIVDRRVAADRVVVDKVIQTSCCRPQRCKQPCLCRSACSRSACRPRTGRRRRP